MSGRKLTTDVLLSGGIRVAVRLRGLIFIPLISVKLGIDGFGAYAQILAITTLLELFFGLGLYAGLVRYGRRSEKLAPLYFALLIVAGLSSALATSVVVALAEPLSRFTLGSPTYTSALRIGALLILTRTLIRLARNYFRIDNRVKQFSVVEGIKAYGVVTVVAVSLLWLETGLAGLFTAMVLWELVVFVGLQTVILREIGIALPAFDEFRQYLEYSIPVAISSLASNATSRIDRVVIGVFLGASAVGVYSVTYQIAIAVKMYVSPIRQAFFPEFSELIDQEEVEKCGRYLRTGLRFFLMIALPSVGGMYLIGPEVLEILTSGSGVPSPVLIGVIGLGLVWQGIDQIYGVALRAAEDTGYRAKIMGIGAGANLLANVLLVPTLGIMGAAIATLLTYLFLSGLTIKRVTRTVHVDFPLGTIIRCSIATMAMVALAPFIGLEKLWQIVLLSVVCYSVSLLLFREVTLSEVQSQLPS